MALWIQSDLEAVVGRDALLRVLDVDNDGVVDAGVLAQLQADADAWILGYVRGNHTYANIVTLLAESPPTQLKRMSLGYAQVLLWQRFPEFFRRDWLPMFEVLRTEAVDVQSGRMRLDIASADTPTPGNVGGVVVDATGEDVALVDYTPAVWSQMGDW